MAIDESVEHVKGNGGLIHGHHVASSKDLEEGEALGSLGGTNLCTSKGVGSGGSFLEGGLTRPLHIVCPGATTEVVADKVLSSRVDQNGDTGSENGGNIDSKVGDPVTEEFGVDNSIALGPPSLGVDVQGSLDGGLSKELVDRGEIVAERGNLTGDADVIHIDGTTDLRLRSHENALHTNIADVERDGPDTRGDRRAASGEDSLVVSNSKGVVEQFVLIEELSVGTILARGINETVTDSDALEVDLQTLVGLVVQNNGLRDGGYVVACVRFTENVEGKRAVLGMTLEKGLQELPHVLRDLILAGHIVGQMVGVGEAGSDGLVDLGTNQMRNNKAASDRFTHTQMTVEFEFQLYGFKESCKVFGLMVYGPFS